MSGSILFILALLPFASLVIQDRIGARRGHRASASALAVVCGLYVWAGLQLFWFAPGGLYFSLMAGPVALVPFALVSLSGFVLGVRLLMAASYLLRGVAAEERIGRIVRYSHAHHLAVFVVFTVASMVMVVFGEVASAVVLALYVSVACAIGVLLGAALGRVGLSESGASRYSILHVQEAS